MFGTLVIQLPCNYTGGKLSVSHLSKKKEFDFGGPKANTNYYYVAFYADCLHEVEPVAVGYRLCLVYNLIWKGSDTEVPYPPDNQKDIATVSAALNKWEKDCNLPESPEMMTYILEHQYSKCGLSFKHLKSTDKVVARVLMAATKEVNFDLYLSMVDASQVWSANEYDDDDYFGYRGRHGYESRCNSPPEAVDLLEENITACSLVSPDNQNIWNVSIDLRSEYIVPDDFLEREPDNFEYNCTGNEGVSVDKQYNFVALLLWPSRNLTKIIGSSDLLSILLTYLNAPGTSDEEKGKMCTLARKIVCQFQSQSYPPRFAEVLSLLESLESLQESVEIIKQVLAFTSTQFITDSRFHKAVTSIVSKHGWNSIHLQLQAMVCKCFPEKNCQFLWTLSSLQPLQDDQKSVCQQLACVVVNQLLEETNSVPPHTKDTICLLYKTLALLEYNERLPQLTTKFITCSKLYPLLTTLAPAILELHNSLATLEMRESLKQLLLHCISNLENSLRCPLSPPATWSHPILITCSCADCQQLKKFLHNPNTMQCRFRMGKQRRQHIHQQLDAHRCPVTHTTEHVGNPHTLIVTKTRKLNESNRPVRQSILASLQALEANFDGPALKKAKSGITTE